MNKLQKAKYSVMYPYNQGAYFELPEEFKKNTDIVKICIVKNRNNVKRIASIVAEYLKYHNLTDQGSLEIIIMLKKLLNEDQKKIICFNLYEELLNRIVSGSTFEEIYAKYPNKVVLHYLIHKQLEMFFRTFKMDRSSEERIVDQFIQIYDQELGYYLFNHKNMLKRYVVPNIKKDKPIEKKLTI
jgi:hypothetical protein